MKKILLVLVIVFCLTGCGNKVICTNTREDVNSKITIEYTATFEKDILTETLTRMTNEFKNESDAKNYCKVLKDIKSLKCNGKKVITEETDKISKDTKITKNEFIENLEKNGYKCK